MSFSTWLSSVARNFCINHYRARKREKEVVVEDLVAFDLAPASGGSNPHRALEDRDRRSFLRRGLESLPEKLREAVVLRDLHGLSYQEMAERLGLPEGTVKSRINRGREELTRLLLRAKQPEGMIRSARSARPRRSVATPKNEPRPANAAERLGGAKRRRKMSDAGFIPAERTTTGGR